MTLGNFSSLIVWQKSLALVVDVYRVSATFPADERFGLVAQIRRAAVSVPSNIAEGHNRSTTGEYLNHVSIARGSLGEVRTLLTAAERLGFTHPETTASVNSSLEEISKMLWRLRRALEDRVQKNKRGASK